ncbi:centromere protein O [Ascaphus truei]|uniref:centromere protein O n=1 Tax=Ascaphus truei TaxID=8439 RepID=UPI003F59CBF9
MEEVQTRFREGVLSHLEQLEALSRNLAVKQDGTRRQHDALEKMRDTIYRLRNQRDELKTKVKLQKAELHALTAQEDVSQGVVHTADHTQQALLEMRLEEVKAMLKVYWLTGISGKLTKKGVCICISTAFEGTYLDSYYLDVVLHPNLRIGHNSVPVFIPLEQIARTHLQEDLKRFLFVLFEHLNAYAGRKYQADQLQVLPEAIISGSPQRNSLCTVLTFQYDFKLEGCAFRFRAKLLYGDVTRCLPTEAIITCKESESFLQEKISAHSILFRQKPLHKALEFCRSEGETLNQTSASVAE